MFCTDEDQSRRGRVVFEVGRVETDSMTTPEPNAALYFSCANSACANTLSHPSVSTTSDGAAHEHGSMQLARMLVTRRTRAGDATVG